MQDGLEMVSVLLTKGKFDKCNLYFYKCTFLNKNKVNKNAEGEIGNK